MPLLPQFDLAGRTAILHVSGGEDAPFLASALAEAGASVFVVSRSQAIVDAALSALSSTDLGLGGLNVVLDSAEAANQVVNSSRT